eukprot:SAG31_NODE_18095_length_647_cov_0.859489_1_plen_125_part_00
MVDHSNRHLLSNRYRIRASQSDSRHTRGRKPNIIADRLVNQRMRLFLLMMIKRKLVGTHYVRYGPIDREKVEQEQYIEGQLCSRSEKQQDCVLQTKGQFNLNMRIQSLCCHRGPFSQWASSGSE